MNARILMAVDDSPASKQEIEYVAGMLDWKSADVRLHLVHVLPPAPGRTEIGEGPHATAGEEPARELLHRLRKRLLAAGAPDERVDVDVLLLRQETSLVEGLLDAARDQECGTIVVGRNSLAWHRELLHRHPADELVRKAHGFAVWVVE